MRLYAHTPVAFVAIVSGAMFALLTTASRVSADPASNAAMLTSELLLPVCGPAECEDNHACRHCAQPATAGAKPTATDALAVLRSAVGQKTCQACVCDVDGSGSVVASDALITLKIAVGQPIGLACPIAS